MGSCKAAAPFQIAARQLKLHSIGTKRHFLPTLPQQPSTSCTWVFRTRTGPQKVFRRECMLHEDKGTPSKLFFISCNLADYDDNQSDPAPADDHVPQPQTAATDRNRHRPPLRETAPCLLHSPRAKYGISTMSYDHTHHHQDPPLGFQLRTVTTSYGSTSTSIKATPRAKCLSPGTFSWVVMCSCSRTSGKMCLRSQKVHHTSHAGVSPKTT